MIKVWPGDSYRIGDIWYVPVYGPDYLLPLNAWAGSIALTDTKNIEFRHISIRDLPSSNLNTLDKETLEEITNYLNERDSIIIERFI